MSISKINGVPLTRTVNPVGLIRGKESTTLENVELRATLEKAVEDAQLNVTERMALNKKFFPNGGGFELFPKNQTVPEFTFYQKKGSLGLDSFSKEVQAVKIPEDICRISQRVRRSSKGCFQKNYENAMKKLKQVLSGKI